MRDRIEEILQALTDEREIVRQSYQVRDGALLTDSLPLIELKHGKHILNFNGVITRKRVGLIRDLYGLSICIEGGNPVLAGAKLSKTQNYLVEALQRASKSLLGALDEQQAVAPISSWGMEIEYNVEERPKPLNEIFNFSDYLGEENDTIFEFGLGVSTSPLQFIRRLCISGLWHDSRDFEMHYEGESDMAAESNHLHFGTGRGNSDLTLSFTQGHANASLLFNNHWVRGNSYRTALTPRATSYVRADNVPSAGSPLKPESKAEWVCWNTLGTAEFRLNGNPAPLLQALLIPVIHSEDISIRTTFTRALCPSQMQDLARSENTGVASMITAKALRYYTHPVLIEIVKGSDATPYAVWKKAHESLLASDTVYQRMVRTLQGAI